VWMWARAREAVRIKDAEVCGGVCIVSLGLVWVSEVVRVGQIVRIKLGVRGCFVVIAQLCRLGRLRCDLKVFGESTWTSLDCAEYAEHGKNV